MTTLADPQAEPTAPNAVVNVGPETRRASGVRPARRTAVVGAAGLVLLVVVGWLFEGPLAHIWYASRQQNLAADLAAKRQHDGEGQATAILQIPRINLDLVIVQGDGPAQLRGGPGHRIATPSAGALGNSLIAGHRTGWGSPFSGLARLQVDDDIVVKNRLDQLPFLFRVTSTQLVSAGDTRVLAPSTDHRLTLVTSAGGRFSSQRLVVVAVSGAQGNLIAGGRRLPADSSRGSALFNATGGLLVLLAGGSFLLVRRMRGSHQSPTIAVMVAPMVLAGLLALLLVVDLSVLPPLR